VPRCTNWSSPVSASFRSMSSGYEHLPKRRA
jgi:hypothetical protein